MNYRGKTSLVLLATALASCAGNPMRQYDSELKETVILVKNGSVKQAIEQVEKNNEPGALSSDKDILYYFEKGELQTLDNNYPGGKESWLKADEFVREWEDAVKTDASKVMGDIGSVLVNDKTRRYDGQDYEKMGAKELAREIKRLENEMFEHAKNLEFEKASEVRDKLASIRKQVFGATPGEDEKGAKPNA